MEPSVSYHEDLIKHLKNPREACTYLNAALAEGDRRHFLRALRNVAEAQGGLLALAKRTHMNRGHLYRLLSEGGNPEVLSLEKLLESMGLQFQIGIRASKKTRKAA